MNDPLMNAVGYMRCSGMGQDSGDTWDRQSTAISGFADARGYSVSQWYREIGVSGKTEQDDRPAFQAMVADVLAAGATVVIVEGLDRLAREYRVQEQLIIYLASKGISLITANTGENVTDAMMGDPMRRALVQIQGIFAELDKNMLVAKLRKARQRAKARDGRCEGQKPYGTYLAERPTLDRVHALRGSGMICREIAAELNSEGLPARAGGLWTGPVIAKILRRSKPDTTLRLDCARINVNPTNGREVDNGRC